MASLDPFSFEYSVREYMDTREDLPDWMHMKAIERSRALDEAQDSGYFSYGVASQLIFGLLALERRLAAVESAMLDQRR